MPIPVPRAQEGPPALPPDQGQEVGLPPTVPRQRRRPVRRGRRRALLPSARQAAEASTAPHVVSFFPALPSTRGQGAVEGGAELNGGLRAEDHLRGQAYPGQDEGDRRRRRRGTPLRRASSSSLQSEGSQLRTLFSQITINSRRVIIRPFLEGSLLLLPAPPSFTPRRRRVRGSSGASGAPAAVAAALPGRPFLL